jgi:hypothetical protein
MLGDDHLTYTLDPLTESLFLANLRELDLRLGDNVKGQSIQKLCLAGNFCWRGLLAAKTSARPCITTRAVVKMAIVKVGLVVVILME